MKIIIYEKGSKQFYQLNDSFELNYDNIKENVKTSLGYSLDKFETNGKNNENSNLRLFTALNSLEKSVRKFRFISYIKKIDTCIYMVSINELKKGSSLQYFELIKDEKLKKVYKKIIAKYDKKLSSDKKDVLKEAWKNERHATNAKKEFVESVLAIIIAVLVAVKEITSIASKSNGWTDISFDTVILGFIAIAVFSLGLTKIVFLGKHKKRVFEMNSKSICFSDDGIDKAVINKSIMENIVQNKKYKDFKTLFIDTDEPFLYSDEVNYNLSIHAKTIMIRKIKNNPILSKSSREALACIINSSLNEDKIIFNGKLLGMSSDLKFNENGVVDLKEVNYYNYKANDEMIYKNILSLNDPTYFIKGTNIALHPATKSFKDMENSPLTNVIGINLIVEVHCNEKEYVIINQQSLTNDVNRNRFVPSASGSLQLTDYYEIKKNNDNISFDGLLKYGMFRELEEESYLDNKFIENHSNPENKEKGKDSFKLLGVARLYTKSGKPDFFGKLELKVNSLDEILAKFDYEQEESIKQNASELEANKMIIVLKEEFINNKKIENMSPQLKYVRYLLSKEQE